MGRLGPLHKLALRAESGIDRLRPRKVPERPVLDAYRGYATPDGVVLRGRVLAALRRTAPDPEHGRWQNLKEMAKLFLTDEVANVPVIVPAQAARAVSDEEGYVTLHLSGRPEGHKPGWCQIAVEIEGDPASRCDFPALLPSSEARLGVISDIDDTVMETGAYSLARNLWTTFTGSALTRRVFPDSVALLDHLSDHGRNPIFYVSSSPWNLHSFLDRIFAEAGLVIGPMFLRDYGLSETQFVTNTHGDHKGGAIDRILAANPGLSFVLIGDTGQHDAEVYREACVRHGGRIAAVVLREPGQGPDDASREAMATIRRLGVPVLHGENFEDVAATLQRAGIGA